MRNFYQKLAEIERSDEKAALCIITQTAGSTPLKTGAKMIVWQNGKIAGTIGGGNLEHKVISDAIGVIELKAPKLFEHHLVQDHKMCCGGSVTIYIEPVMKAKKLYVFGAGHIGSNVVELALKLDFQISLMDERNEFLEPFKNTEIDIFAGNHKNILPELVFDENTFIVICTHLHEYDREILAYCIRKPNAYLGMIGSKRKIMVARKQFLDENIASKEELERVDMPMGFDIGGNMPEEIGISIIAKIIQVKNKKVQNNIKQFDKVNEETDCNSYGSR